MTKDDKSGGQHRDKSDSDLSKDKGGSGKFGDPSKDQGKHGGGKDKK